MTNRSTLFILLLLAGTLSCEMAGFEKSKSGLRYRIIRGDRASGNADTLRPGMIVKFNYRMTYNDSVLGSSYETIPGYDMVDSNPRFHDFAEVLTKLRVGDSLVTYQFIDTLGRQNPGMMPPFLKKGTKIKMTLRVLDTIANGMAGVQEDVMREEEKILGRETSRIEKFIALKKWKTRKVNNVYVEVISQGSGPAADSGKYVGIKYTGYTLEGKYFDSNMDSTKQSQKHPLDTFYFFSKTYGAIQGMMEGVAQFNVGGKGRVIIPSPLAYGRQGSPPAIKPYEPLVFDIEVVSARDTVLAPQPGPPGMQ
jgi:FKBP-type peptidyl-prolyl cis-trans isomerase FkpA